MTTPTTPAPAPAEPDDVAALRELARRALCFHEARADDTATRDRLLLDLGEAAERYGYGDELVFSVLARLTAAEQRLAALLWFAEGVAFGGCTGCEEGAEGEPRRLCDPCRARTYLRDDVGPVPTVAEEVEAARQETRDAREWAERAVRERSEVEARLAEVEAKLDQALKKYEGWDYFVGPCAHGRDPYTRCDECGSLPAPLALRAAWLASWTELTDTLRERDSARATLADVVEQERRQRERAKRAEAVLAIDVDAPCRTYAPELGKTCDSVGLTATGDGCLPCEARVLITSTTPDAAPLDPAAVRAAVAAEFGGAVTEDRADTMARPTPAKPDPDATLRGLAVLADAARGWRRVCASGEARGADEARTALLHAALDYSTLAVPDVAAFSDADVLADTLAPAPTPEPCPCNVCCSRPGTLPHAPLADTLARQETGREPGFVETMDKVRDDLAAKGVTIDAEAWLAEHVREDEP